ncbi:holo-ACP synthase [Thalassobacillus sp. CUG 92003]|uniref:holo-ACP synthase n=1 Tax=Thalassobacillus sp. CUG 92003 TaxID=2736641 RepID=UPI0015E76BFA|nr:holo-ACP synthase [Thalassobacillus sp. CUG 92003]
MIKGIGVDVIEIDRINQSIKRNDRFLQRILTEAEQQKAADLSERRQAEYVAGRFAAKEAFAKAVGTGIGALQFTDIEIITDLNGAPRMTAAGYEDQLIWVSISHSKDVAIAQVIIEETRI